MSQETQVIGALAARPDLRYLRRSVAEFAEAQRAAGVSDNVPALMVEVLHAINSGHTRALLARSARTTTPTSIESFVTDMLLPRLDAATTARS
jgi:hypothetical protein